VKGLGWAAAPAIAVALAACGLKNAPVAPELVRPLPPAKVTAAPARDGVRLSWRRPAAYTGGGRMRDLGGFDIERAAGAGGSFIRTGTLALADQQRFRQVRTLEWTDHAVEPGTVYVYRVIAFTLDGARSAPSAPIEVRYDRPRPAAADVAR
jgi:hypothetical protein